MHPVSTVAVAGADEAEMIDDHEPELDPLLFKALGLSPDPRPNLGNRQAPVIVDHDGQLREIRCRPADHVKAGPLDTTR